MKYTVTKDGQPHGGSETLFVHFIIKKHSWRLLIISVNVSIPLPPLTAILGFSTTRLPQGFSQDFEEKLCTAYFDEIVHKHFLFENQMLFYV